jgi:hypothetical protein
LTTPIGPPPPLGQATRRRDAAGSLGSGSASPGVSRRDGRSRTNLFDP